MRWYKEFIEPWGLLLGASAGGVAWAVQLPVAAAVGIGAAAWLARAGVASISRSPAAPERAPLPPVDERTQEGGWLRRARAAARDFAALADELPAGPVAERMTALKSEVDDTVDTVHRLTAQANTTGRALARIDPGALAAEHQRLSTARRRASEEITAELDRSLQSVRSQQDVHERLSGARAKQLAQLESGTLGLESLVARLVELSTTTATTSAGPAGTLAGMTDELEGIRRGVEETEAATRRTLGDV